MEHDMTQQNKTHIKPTTQMQKTWNKWKHNITQQSKTLLGTYNKKILNANMAQ
jgi:hypothetical protein